jgi:hypothetical protein
LAELAPPHSCLGGPPGPLGLSGGAYRPSGGSDEFEPLVDRFDLRIKLLLDRGCLGGRQIMVAHLIEDYLDLFDGGK